MAIRLDGHLGALFDRRGDMVEADGALEEGEQRVRVHGAQLQARLLHQHGLHGGVLLLLGERTFKIESMNIKCKA